MPTLPNEYFGAYRSLKMTRDASGVLIAEFHTSGGPFTFTAQDHTELVDAFYRIARLVMLPIPGFGARFTMRVFRF